MDLKLLIVFSSPLWENRDRSMSLELVFSKNIRTMGAVNPHRHSATDIKEWVVVGEIETRLLAAEKRLDEAAWRADFDELSDTVLLKADKEELDRQVADLVKKVYYNAATGMMTVTKEDGTQVEFSIPKDSFVESGYYDAENRNIVLVTNTGNQVVIPASDLAKTYYGENTTSANVVIHPDTNTISVNVQSEYIKGVKVNNAVTADSAVLVGQLRFFDLEVPSLNFFWGTVGGTAEQRLCSKEQLKVILSGITTIDWSAKNITANGVLTTKSFGFTTTIGSMYANACHYMTDSPMHYFNKTVNVDGSLYVGGDVFAGVAINRRLAYVDEIAGIKVTNADTAERLTAGAWEVKESGGELLVIKSGVTIAKFNDTGIVSMRDVTANV